MGKWGEEVQSAWGSLPCPVKPHCHPYHSHTNTQLLLVCLSGHRGADLTCTLPPLCVNILTHPLSWSGWQGFFGSPSVPFMGVMSCFGTAGLWGSAERSSGVGELGWDGCSHRGNERGVMPLCWDFMGMVLGDGVWACPGGSCPLSPSCQLCNGAGCLFPVTSCPVSSQEGVQYPSAACCFILGHLMFSAALPCSQWVGWAMGARNPWAPPAFLKRHLPPLH